MPDIFLSYVEEDGDIAAQLAASIEAAGFKAWTYQRDSLPGLKYLEQVSAVIDQARVVVVLVSLHSLGSQQVENEIVRAYETKRAFLPVLIGLSHAEFQSRQPLWRQAFGAATSIRLGDDRRQDYLRVVQGISALMQGGAGQPAAVQPTPPLPKIAVTPQMAPEAQDVSPPDEPAPPDDFMHRLKRQKSLVFVLGVLAVVFAGAYFLVWRPQAEEQRNRDALYVKIREVERQAFFDEGAGDAARQKAQEAARLAKAAAMRAARGERGYVEENGEGVSGRWHYAGEGPAKTWTGFGVLTWKDGVKYEGMFKNGQRNGFGIENDHLLYAGEWTEGRRNGYGVATEPSSGCLYSGLWKNGGITQGRRFGCGYRSETGNWNGYELDGLGKRVLKSGEEWIGVWRHGELATPYIKIAPDHSVTSNFDPAP